MRRQSSVISNPARSAGKIGRRSGALSFACSYLVAHGSPLH